MAATESSMVPIMTPASDFSLLDAVTGQRFSLADFEDKKLLLVMFICRHCPYVKHVAEQLAQLAKDYQGRDLGIVSICSNDPTDYPEDRPAALKEMALQYGFSFPILVDDTQEVAKSYGATCTPDFFLYNKSRKLAYRGQLDQSRPGNDIPVTGSELREAIESTMQDKEIFVEQRPSLGCSIKWKIEN